MLNIFKYRIIYMLHEKYTLFWLLAFPICLSVFFWLAFGNLMEPDDSLTEAIKVAAVNTNKSAPLYTAMNESDMFEFTETDKDAALELLDNGDVIAIVDFSGSASLTFSEMGINQSVVKIFADICVRANTTITNIIKSNPEVLEKGFLEKAEFNAEYTKPKPISDASNIVVFFYALLANSALMGATAASDCVNQLIHGVCSYSDRVIVSPRRRTSYFAASVSATLLTHMLSTLITCFFMRFVLGIDFGDSFSAVILVCLVGCFAGIMLGAMVAALVRANEMVKGAVLIAVTLLSSTIAGMMGLDIKLAAEKAIPALAVVNPSTLLTDALQSLYYYGISDMYYRNVVILFVSGIVMAIVTIAALKLRETEK